MSKNLSAFYHAAMAALVAVRTRRLAQFKKKPDKETKQRRLIPDDDLAEKFAGRGIDLEVV